MTLHAMDCDAFDALLADYLEGDLDHAQRHEVDAHLASCVRCAALVRDLERIRADASELPELVPSNDLWRGIAHRIDTPVVPFAAKRTSDVTVAPSRWDRFRRAAIAAALVVVTAGVTYTWTVARNGQGSGTTTIAQVPASVDSTRRVTGSDSARDAREIPTAVASVPVSDVPATAGASSGTPNAQRVRSEPAATTYSREIDRLRTIFVQNRAKLDPRTAAIIEANLKVIDEAIAQSKAALAQDPASRFLTEQLNSTLDKKLELLRTAALLPNRT